MKKGTTQANGNGGGGHDGGAGEEPDGHSKSSNGVATSDYIGLKSHKKTYISTILQTK